jgi:hypothetical protein
MGFKGHVKKVLDEAAKEAARWPKWIRDSDVVSGRRKPIKKGKR